GFAVESSGDETGALCETVVFLGYFKDLPDARQSGKVKYPLDEILLLCLLAMVAGAETITDIARFGRLKLALLRRFRPFEDGTPAHDHLGDILATLDTEAFERCFVAWVAAQTGVPAEVVAIDGKTVRRSGSKTSKKKKNPRGPIHIVSAFAARQRLVLGQVKVAEKSNEIVAIPKLLRMLELEGAVVTIDAMGCQRDIAQTIIDKKADYILALKGNQGTLKDGGKIDREMRLYITSLVLLAHQIGPMIRGHWMIENGLHWVLDMVFRDDECRVRTDNAPANLATLKHMAYNVMRRAATKDSMRLRRKVAAWDDDFLASLIAA